MSHDESLEDTTAVRIYYMYPNHRHIALFDAIQRPCHSSLFLFACFFSFTSIFFTLGRNKGGHHSKILDELCRDASLPWYGGDPAWDSHSQSI